MDSLMKLLSTVIDTMARNEPLLESVIILPLILKHYRWVLLGCLGVAVVTFGVEMRNDYALSNLLSAAHVTLFFVQGAILFCVSALVFAAKTAVLRALNISEPRKPEAG